MPEKPDYVLNFSKPINTEIKHINGHWYLYERTNVYDQKIGRSRKKSGRILGSITEQGLIPSKARMQKTNGKLNDVVEFGAVRYFYQHTEEMRIRLKQYFPDCGNAFTQLYSSGQFMTAASEGSSCIMRTVCFLIFILVFLFPRIL